MSTEETSSGSVSTFASKSTSADVEIEVWKLIGKLTIQDDEGPSEEVLKNAQKDPDIQYESFDRNA